MQTGGCILLDQSLNCLICERFWTLRNGICRCDSPHVPDSTFLPKKCTFVGVVPPGCLAFDKQCLACKTCEHWALWPVKGMCTCDTGHSLSLSKWACPASVENCMYYNDTDCRICTGMMEFINGTCVSAVHSNFSFFLFIIMGIFMLFRWLIWRLRIFIPE
jgi:hypothetical protein